MPITFAPSNDAQPAQAAQITPETQRSPITESLPLDDRSLMQAEAALDRSVNEYVARCSDSEVFEIADALGKMDLDPALKAELQERAARALAAGRDLSGAVQSTIFGTAADPKSAEQVQERIEKILGTADADQLTRLARAAYGPDAQLPENPEQLRALLSNGEAMQRVLSDPSMSAEIAQLMLNSGTLSDAERALVQRTLSNYQERMAELREIVAEGLKFLLLTGERNRLDQSGVTAAQSSSYAISGDPTSDTSSGRRYFASPLDEDKGFDQFKREEEILFGLEKDLRRRNEQIEMREQELDEVDDRLMRAIEELKRENSSLMKSLRGISLEQENYQDAMQHPGKMTLDQRGEVYLFVDEERKRQAGKAA